MNGGYKIIDFKKVALSSTRTAIEGIMEDLTENNGKVVLLTNVVIGETEMDDCFSTVIVKSDQSIKLNCYDGYISINTSGVKYTSASVENLAEAIGDLDDLETTEKDSLVGAINEIVSNVEPKTVEGTTIDDFIIGSIGSFLTSENTGKVFTFISVWTGNNYYGIVLFVMSNTLGIGIVTAGTSTYSFKYVPGTSFDKVEL